MPFTARVCSSYKKKVTTQRIVFKNMATAITTQSATLEGQLVEIITLMQQLEAAAETNPNNRNFVISTLNLDNRTLSATINLPIFATAGTGGKLTVEPSEYLVDAV